MELAGGTRRRRLAWIRERIADAKHDRDLDIEWAEQHGDDPAELPGLWWYTFPSPQYSDLAWVRRIALAFLAWACKRKGHDWEDESWANTESGGEGGYCKRCGYDFKVTYY